MQIIKNPCQDQFFDLVCSAKNSIKLCSPFVKKGIVDIIYKVKIESSELTLVTSAPQVVARNAQTTSSGFSQESLLKKVRIQVADGEFEEAITTVSRISDADIECAEM